MVSSVARAGNSLEVRREGRIVFSASIVPHIAQLDLDGGHISFMLPAGLGEGAVLRTSSEMKRALQNGRPLQIFDGRQIRPLPTGGEPQRLEVELET